MLLLSQCRSIFKRAKEQNCQNNIQTFDAIKLEKLFKIVEIKKTVTHSIWAAASGLHGFAMKDGKS
jgi:hypothetical protein